MSQYDDDDEDFEGGSTISEIRKALRAAEKRNKALEQELQTFRAESRKREIAASIEARGLNPKIAGLIPQDTDPAAWIEEFGELFAAPAPAAEPADEQAVAPPEGASTFSEVANTGATPVGDEGQLIALIKGAKTPEELNRVLFGA
jgi:hypothetical protein